MGLDYVELIMRTEKEFGIVISDAECGEISTVGDLYRCVCNKVALSTRPGCLTSRAFYRVRRALVECYGLAREQVRPDTGLEEILPPQKRLDTWRRFRRSLKLNTPDIFVRSFGVASLIWLPPLAGLLFCLYHSVFQHHSLYLCILPPVSFVWMILLGCVTQPFAVRVSDSCASVGDLSRRVLAMNIKEIRESNQAWREMELWEALRVMIADQIGVKLEEVVDEARFQDDLGIN